MPQFAVYKNTNTSTKAIIPFLLDVQSNLMADLGTRVVVPLYTAASMKGKVIKTLMPVFEVDGKKYVMMTPQLAGISRKKLGVQVADLSVRRDQIIAAIDLLITGI